jgi:WD40 repeat protein
VQAVAISPDRNYLATGSPDGTVRVYALDVKSLISRAEERLGGRPDPCAGEPQ